MQKKSLFYFGLDLNEAKLETPLAPQVYTNKTNIFINFINFIL